MAKMMPGDVVSVEFGFFDNMQAIVLEECNANTEKVRILTEDGILAEAAGKDMILLGLNLLKMFVGVKR